MKKVTIPALLAMAALAVPAAGVAKKPDNPGAQGKAKSHKCKPHRIGFVASGTLTASALTQSKGAETPADTSDDRYSGTVSLTVTKTNHHAKGYKGAQTITVTDVKVKSGEGVTAPPAVGSKVKLIGKITQVAKKCADKSGAGVVTIRQVNFSAPAPAPAPAPAG